MTWQNWQTNLYRKEHSSRGVAAHALEQADRRSVEEESLVDFAVKKENRKG